MGKAEGFGGKAEEAEGCQGTVRAAEGAEEMEKGGFRGRRERLRKDGEGEVEVTGGCEATAEEGDRGGVWTRTGCRGGVEEAEGGEGVPLRSD